MKRTLLEERVVKVFITKLKNDSVFQRLVEISKVAKNIKFGHSNKKGGRGVPSPLLTRFNTRSEEKT